VRFQRTIPPTAAPVSFADLMRGLLGLGFEHHYRERIEADIRSVFRVKHAFLVSSGKGALTLILTSLKSLSPRQKVVIPAYTCFSVPSAVLKAGLELTLCDVDPETLDFDLRRLEALLDEDTLCVMPTHLFGLPAAVDAVISLSKRAGAFVVEDAAQAMGGTSRGRSLGTIGDVGFFSLGRGKSITCGSGGIIVTNSEEIGNAIRAEFERLTPEPRMNAARDILSLLALRLFIAPCLYWFPAGLPFLKLGETTFPRNFPLHRLAGAKAAVLVNWQDRLAQATRLRRLATRALLDVVTHEVPSLRPTTDGETTYLRIPLLLARKDEKARLCQLSKEYGLGISPCYPSGIHAIPEVPYRPHPAQFPGATTVAERLVTLPVHHLIRPEDYRRMWTLIHEQLRISVNMMALLPEPSSG